jgi:hypothetical protein
VALVVVVAVVVRFVGGDLPVRFVVGPERYATGQ